MNNNYEHKLQELDNKISDVETSINKINKLELDKQKKNIKKLYKAYVRELNALADNVLVWDTRFKKFWRCPEITEYDSVRDVIYNSNSPLNKDSELFDVIKSKSGSEITYQEFEYFYIEGYSQDSHTLFFYLFDRDSYEDSIRFKYMKENSCGMAESFVKNIFSDIRLSCENEVTGAYLMYQIQYEYGQNYDDENSSFKGLYNYKLEFGNRFYTHYSTRSTDYTIDYIKIANDLLVHNRLLLNSSNFVVMTNEFANKTDVSYFPNTSDLTDELNELKRQRRINYRQMLYNKVDSTTIEPLNVDTLEKMTESGYLHRRMNSWREFHVNKVDSISGVTKVDVLKRLESKVKLRISINKFFYVTNNKLMTSQIGDAKRVLIPMYIDKLVDPRLYLDFLQGYNEKVEEFGVLDIDKYEDVKFDKHLYNNVSQSYKVDNWKWKFPAEILDSYDTSELTLTAW